MIDFEEESPVVSSTQEHSTRFISWHNFGSADTREEGCDDTSISGKDRPSVVPMSLPGRLTHSLVARPSSSPRARSISGRFPEPGDLVASSPSFNDDEGLDGCPEFITHTTSLQSPMSTLTSSDQTKPSTQYAVKAIQLTLEVLRHPALPGLVHQPFDFERPGANENSASNTKPFRTYIPKRAALVQLPNNKVWEKVIAIRDERDALLAKGVEESLSSNPLTQNGYVSLSVHLNMTASTDCKDDTKNLAQSTLISKEIDRGHGVDVHSLHPTPSDESENQASLNAPDSCLDDDEEDRYESLELTLSEFEDSIESVLPLIESSDSDEGKDFDWEVQDPTGLYESMDRMMEFCDPQTKAEHTMDSDVEEGESDDGEVDPFETVVKNDSLDWFFSCCDDTTVESTRFKLNVPKNNRSRAFTQDIDARTLESFISADSLSTIEHVDSGNCGSKGNAQDGTMETACDSTLDCSPSIT